ncbi:hypothetical protein [Spirosoma spitsbergense]|nr:hypothetical protein [Spirosoma spitsbergense]
MNHFTHWFYESSTPYAGIYPPFFVVSIYERSGPTYSKHLVIQLN